VDQNNQQNTLFHSFDLLGSESTLTADDLISVSKEIGEEAILTPHPTTIGICDATNDPIEPMFNFLHHLPITPTSPLALRQNVVNTTPSSKNDSGINTTTGSSSTSSSNSSASSSNSTIPMNIPNVINGILVV
jgi:hypothetical protein